MSFHYIHLVYFDEGDILPFCLRSLTILCMYSDHARAGFCSNAKKTYHHEEITSKFPGKKKVGSNYEGMQPVRSDHTGKTCVVYHTRKKHVRV
jgi:hypothetical protein